MPCLARDVARRSACKCRQGPRRSPPVKWCEHVQRPRSIRPSASSKQRDRPPARFALQDAQAIGPLDIAADLHRAAATSSRAATVSGLSGPICSSESATGMTCRHR